MDHVCGGHWLHGLVVFDWCRIDQLNFSTWVVSGGSIKNRIVQARMKL